MAVELKTPPGEVPAADVARSEIGGTAPESRFLFAGVTVALIWLGTAAASVWSPTTTRPRPRNGAPP